MILSVKYSKGQLKIQEMAFVLVAIMIFFAMIALIYFSVRLNSLEGDVQNLEDDYAKEIVKKITLSPEFSWESGSCDSCLDFDKAFLLKDRKSYQNFWELDYLAVERVHPVSNRGECNNDNYPDCGIVTIRNVTKGAPADTFVSICRIEDGKTKCELGRIYASGRNI